MACRLPRYLAIIRMSSSSQEALDGLDGVGEPTALAPVVRVRIAFDEATRFKQLDAERGVAARGGQGLVEPGLQMCRLVAMAQRAAPEAAPAGQQIERHEPADRAGVHASAAIDYAPQRRHQARARLDPEAEPGRQGAADFL